MFSLDRSKNDTSVTLDLLRAMAAQMVCVGHAMNFGRTGYTFVPNDGVLLFFILSGFLIAYTLDTKSGLESYGLIDFGIERVARIYTAYLPALLLIGAVTVLAERYGIEMRGDPTNLRTYLGNLVMLQNVPCCWRVSTFGTAGHLTSVAVEFHIYFFVGAIYFLLRRKNMVLCFLVAVLFSTMPLAYFAGIAQSDHALFVLWLLGFASYFTVRSMSGYRECAPFFVFAFLVCLIVWIRQRTPGDDWNIRQYPMLIFSFFSIVVVSQAVRLIPERLGKLITLVADYSFSLFLIHLTILRVIYALFPQASVARTLIGIVVSNVLAIVFAFVFERRYRQVASAIKVLLGRSGKRISSKLDHDAVDTGRQDAVTGIS
ncbi:acyltransferase [Bradyrhizobium sp. dw_78]|uniref:acyltransferase family protein n=1 Tax=Bradyrhizobium sp. dw_78 TaxID=2719793 RepID=UPI001BD379B6